jgi:hypothetical protein
MTWRQVVDVPPVKPQVTEHQMITLACRCGCRCLLGAGLWILVLGRCRRGAWMPLLLASLLAEALAWFEDHCYFARDFTRPDGLHRRRHASP